MLATFYLGTHMPHWLRQIDIPLFVSHRRLMDRKTLPRAIGSWALDSGGFTELHTFGGWNTTPTEYVTAVRRYADEIGNMDWAAPQDWMCEPSALAATGGTVAGHQMRTVTNYLQLRDQLGDLVVPVLQGWERDDYLRCVDLYDTHGVDLTLADRIGLGSVCRRNAESDIAHIVADLQPLRLHAFGIKGAAWKLVNDRVVSADSMAWSANGRRQRTVGHSHKSCANCLEFAMRWYRKTLAQAEQRLPLGV